ncbi:ACT domain-containing protein [Parasutterella muris]|uniref:ACT domain-containing protein n=1 Tax=Parasutterella muris TaxID=2565572 RepID=UPI00203A480F|nr:ACT domain-containing protein [Parasutterella muris]
MKQILLAVTGPDSFGVVYTTASALSKLGCNFINMNQTTLCNQFSSLMIVEKPEELSNEDIQQSVKKELCEKGFDMSVTTRDIVRGEETLTEGEPFVITVDGPQEGSKDILTAFTHVFYEGRINIDSFRSIEQPTDEDGKPLEKARVLLVFEVTVPFDADRKALHRTLADIAHDRHLSMSMQHRRIFEAIHRIIVG